MKKIVKYDKHALAELNKFEISIQRDFLGLIGKLEIEGRLEYPNSKKITKDLFEMRIKSGNAYRGFYIYAYGNLIIILHFFKKKSRKTPIKNLKLAERRLKKYV